MTPPLEGWDALLAPPNPFHAEGAFPIRAYSEYMPPPSVGLTPSGALDGAARDPGDPHGLLVSEYEEAHELRPGLEHLAHRLGRELRRLGAGHHALSKALLTDNPYWPPELAARAGRLAHERYVLLVPLALSRTLDDKGRVRWTLFGASEQGPARPFWRSFQVAPGRELDAGEGEALLTRLFAAITGAPLAPISPRATPASGAGRPPTDDPRRFDLRAAGLRVLPAGPDPDFPHWAEEPLPACARDLVLTDEEAPGDGRYLLTFRPFARLPPAVKAAYLDGALELWPFPGSLVFFGHAGYRALARELPLAMQIPLLHLFPGRHAAPTGLRIPQSGWLDEPRPSGAASAGHPAHAVTHGPVVSHVKRTSRWNRSRRDDDETELVERLDRVARALFSTAPEELGLYGKPMARNAQIWTVDHHLLLDGPRAGRRRLEEAAHALAAGGHFGYRFLFPPMRAGRHDLYWQRPLCAAFAPGAGEDAAPTVIHGGPLGYVTAYRHEAGPTGLDPAAPVELWPRLRARSGHVEAAELFEEDPGHRRHQTAYDVRKLLEAHETFGALAPSYARRLLTTSKERTLDEWLAALPARAADPARGAALAGQLRRCILPAEPPLAEDPATGLPLSHTYPVTASRDFEERYFATLAELAEGRYVHRDNADLADAAGALPAATGNDLDPLADELHRRHRLLLERHGMTGRALVADHRFRWQTDFDFPWSGGWSRNQIGRARERNVVVIIPGRDRSEAVLMGDHYDTAYMEDVYETARGGDLTRRSAAGADDNCSATAALLMAADVLLPLARAGRLRRDVWLVHLTGEEFPSDCLGARNLVERIVEGTFAVTAGERGLVPLSDVTIRGAFILDMIAHNHDHDRYVFQIAPGEGPPAARLGRRAHLATERWNRSVPRRNRAPERRAPGPSARMPSGAAPPPTVAHAHMDGEIRPAWHFKSSLYNTDGQIFSDAGIPVVLLMENYDIHRTGYHDTHDTVANIDLDYGAALAAIAIETVAEVAIAEDP